MSSSIDQRIVEMQFNNRQFESGVSETLSSLDKLKNSLDVLGSGETLQNLSDIDTSGMKSFSDSVETASSKFSALEEIAIGALRRIGEMAVNAGTNLVRNLTNQLVFDNINAGWDKYADKTQAVQTIMAATRNEFAESANQMEIVNEQLDRLNWFTDETSYNFTDMVGNIGKFTSAGIGLEDSTNAMMGIATWAAMSGANAQTASRAMYQLSQALGSGNVQLRDWMSIEQANMATVEFKQTALDTAVAEGTLIKVNDNLYKTLKGNEVSISNFRDTLQYDWFSGSALIETLKVFGEYSSKLEVAQERIKDITNDYGETTAEILKDVNKYIDGTLDLNDIQLKQGHTVEELIEQFDLLSKSEDDLGRRAFEAAEEALTFQQALDSVKDAASTTWMNIFEDVFGDYEHAKVLWTDLANALWDTFVGPLANLESVVSEWASGGGNAFAIQGVLNIWEAFSSVIGAVGAGLSTLFPPMTAERLIELTKGFRDFTEKLKPSEDTLQAITNTVKGLLVPFQAFFGILKQIVSFAFPPLLSLGGKVLALLVRLTGFLGSGLTNGFNFITTNVNKLITVLGQVKSAIFSQLESPIQRVKDSIGKMFESIFGKFRFEGINIFETLGQKITDFTDLIVKSIAKWGFKNWFDGSFKEFGDNIADAFEKAADAVEKYDIKGKVGIVLEFLQDAFGKLIEIFNNVKNAVIEFDIAGKVTTLCQSIETAFINIKNSVSTYINEHEKLKAVVDWFKGIYESIKALVDEYGIFKTIGGGLALAFNTVKSGFTKAFSYIQSSEILSKIGNAFITGFENVKNFAIYLYDVFSPYVSLAINKVKEFFSSFEGVSLESIINWFTELRDAAKTPIEFIEKLGEGLSNFGSVIQNFFIQNGVIESIENLFITIGDAIKNLAIAVKSAFGDANAIEIFEKVLDIIKIIVAIKAMNSLEKVGNSISGFFNSLSSFFKKEKKQSFSKTMIEVAAALAILAGSLWVIAQIPADRLPVVADMMGRLMIALLTVALTIPIVNKFLGTDLVKTGSGLLMLVGAIGLMVGIVKLIEVSGISFETVKEHAEAFIVTFGLIALMLVASKLAGRNAAKGGVGILLMSIALGLIIGVFKELAKIDDGTIDRGKKVVSDMLGVFAGVMALSLFSGKNAAKAGTMMIKMAIALGLISICIGIVGKMDSAQLKQGIKAMSEMMIVMGIVMAMSAFSSKGTKSITAMAFAIAIIAGSLVILTRFSAGKEMAGAVALSTVLGFLALAFFSLSRSRATFFKSLGVAIVLGLVLYEIVGALLILSNFNGEHIFANSGALARVLFSLGGAFKALAKINGSIKKMAGTAAVMGLVLFEIVGALVILNKFGGDGMFGNAMVLSLVLNVLVGVFKKFSKITATTKKMQSTAYTMGIVLGAIAGSLAILGQFGGDHILRNALALSAVLVVLVKVFENFKPIKASIGDCLKTAVMMAAVLGAVVGALVLLNKFGGDKILQNTLAISATLVALGIVIGVLSGFRMDIKSAGVVALEMGLLLAEIVGALILLEKFGGESVLDNALSLSAVALALSAAIGIFSLLGVAAIGGAIAAVGSVFIFLGGLALVFDWFGQWAADKAANIEAGIAIAAKLGEGIGAFAGNIVKGFGDAAFGSLPTYGQNLSDFGENLKGFLDTLNEAPEGVAGKAVEVSKAIAAITAAELLQGMANWLGAFAAGGVASFGQQLSSFGQSFSTFVSSMNDIEISDAVTAASSVAEAMVALAVSIPNSGGVLGWIMGNNDIDIFGARLNNFAIYFKNFIKTLTGEDMPSDYKTAVDACKAATECMIALADQIPNSGGVLGWIMGENDIDDFGRRLSSFALSFKRFVIILTSEGMPKDYKSAVDACAAATECMITLSKEIPNSGGVLGWIVGNNDLDDFGKRLCGFAIFFKSFITTLTGNDMPKDYQGAVDACKAATECMIALGTEIPNTGGLLGFIVGNNDLDDFGAKLSIFAVHFTSFIKTLTGNDMPTDYQSAVEASAAAAEIIANFANTKINKTGGLLELFTGDNYQGLADFGTGLQSLGMGLGGYYDQLKTIDLEAVEKSFNLFQQIIDVANLAMNTETSSLINIVDGMRSVGTSMISAFTSVFAGTDEGARATGMINAALDIFFGNFNTALDTKKAVSTGHITTDIGPAIVAAFDESMLTDDLEAIGVRVVEDIENGIIDEQDPDAVGVCTEMGEALTNAVNEILPSDVWYDVGVNAVAGLAQGIADNTSAAVEAAAAMASAVETAAAVTLKVQSPSRVFMRIGDYVVQGFARGITDNTSKATGAVSSMANNVVDKVTSLAAFIAAAIDDEMDISPVITPVLDMANVESGVAGMDAMFGARSIGTVGVAVPGSFNDPNNSLTKLTDTMQSFINHAQNAQSAPINIYVTGGSNDSADDIANAVMDRLNVELQRRRAAMG